MLVVFFRLCTACVYRIYRILSIEYMCKSRGCQLNYTNKKKLKIYIARVQWKMKIDTMQITFDMNNQKLCCVYTCHSYKQKNEKQIIEKNNDI